MLKATTNKKIVKINNSNEGVITQSRRKQQQIGSENI